MKTVFKILLFTLFALCLNLNAQYKGQAPENQQPFDLNSKAQELDITAEQLSGILNSVNEDGSIKEGDPLPEAMQERFFTGQAVNDEFGYSVSNAGDVNGDGFSDIIVGAVFNDAGGYDAGRAYIYYGGLSMDKIPDVMLTGVAALDYFGYSVSGAGDVNGDGYSDVIVGAYNNDAGGTDAGRAYIYLGGVGMDNIADVILTGEAVSDWFGEAVSTAGDVNGDGYTDIVVGAFGNDAGGSNAGRAYIYFGGSAMDNTVDVTLIGESAGDWFGDDVTTAGDVNGDGYSDVIVGAPSNNAGGTDAGRAYIYYGGASMDNTADIILTGETEDDYFGYSVSSAGDVDGDGYTDVIVGAYNNDAGGTNAGRAYIYFGGASMDNTTDVILTGEAAGDNLGISVSSAGDVNGDGYTDVILGAPFNNTGGYFAGRAYIYYGGASMDNIADIILTGESAGDHFGYSVSEARDVNGDGYADVMVGAYGNDAGGSNAGRAYLYTNSLTGTDIPDEFFTGEAVNEKFGRSVSSAGDVNGDGFSDVIVGAFGNDATGTDAGRAYIYFGGTGMNNTVDVTLTGESAGDLFGYSVSTAGDVNGDGYTDVIVGAYGNDAGTGRAYIYFGGAIMDNTADITFTGEAPLDFFGTSVSSAGDVNGDGYSDVIVGANYNNAGGTWAGKAYIYFGGTGMDNTVDVTLTGEAGGDNFGHCVSSAGDLNGDGYADVIVGAHRNDEGGIDAGKVYIYFGGNPMDSAYDLSMIGKAAEDLFGASVSNVGDVNGDGYSDIIVGALYNDTNGSDAGSAYIYFGSASMDDIEDVILNGEAADDYFGTSVSGAGDINEDGYADVIVGAIRDYLAGTRLGRVYIYFGGLSMNNTSDIIQSAEAAMDWFGYSVSTAGDINGDGFSDVIVGAYNNDAGGTNAGRAYLYLSSSPPIKPRIMSVKDVPFDQGGQVKLKWVRNGYDVQGISKITDYLIQRSDPPDINGFAWETISTMLASHEPFYSYVAETPNDSMTNNSGTYYFRITARTANPNEYWRSNIMYGHSVDNLAPLEPMSFYANKNGSDIHLGWQANTEPDLYNYVIYRTDYPNADPDTLVVYAQSTDTTYTDTNPLTGTAYYYLRAQDIHNNLSLAVEDSVSEQITFALSVSINNGWNMVSVPGTNAAGMAVGDWWPGLTGTVFKFVPGSGYSGVTTTAPTKGYWMKHTGSTVYNYPAIGIVASEPIAAAAGWNMIGGYEDVVDVNTLSTNPSGQLTLPIYEYIPGSGYGTAANLVPGYGYWAKTSSACDIIVPDLLLAKGSGEKVEYFKEEWGRVVIRDAEGKTYTLYAVTGEVDLDRYELPPLPPQGMFDIRYGSGRIAEDINSSMQTIDMMGVSYPITVRVDGMDIRLQDVTSSALNVSLKSGEEVVISDATIQKLMVSGETIPTVYALQQNYPNPFNPSTRIQYQVPSITHVTLKVYDILGNEVAKLVDEYKPAGSYEVEFSGEGLSSGVYFYQLKVGEFISTKKMILLK